MRRLFLAVVALATFGPMVMAAGKTDERGQATAQHAPLTVLAPPSGEKAYQIAAEEFVRLWEKVTSQRPALRRAEPALRNLPPGNVVVIGSDAVQPVVHELIRSKTLESLGIEYGGDGYRILSLKRDKDQCLILAGGSGRSTLYAVYDFFRRQAGVEYFWDGDVIPQRAQIPWDSLDVRETPRFEYRGLRYFAHRGLHRFQAEHWDLDDWKREIDWLVKKRFNLFMLRAGIDDLFQRAFPGEVPYPPTDGRDPDAKPRSYDDRTSFWPLKYRGELRKQVLQYARDRGLLHPEDTGTITHWYSHTPSSFYRSHPDFPVIRDQKTGYTLSTHAIWDIESEQTWETYWKLTATHIREFGCPRIFHTIGMAERTFGKDARDNLQRKLYVYRKTQQTLREHYPDAPLLIASWDLAGWWKDADVQTLLAELDPQRTIILDYTADCADKVTYRDWAMAGHFPWIFGIFHGFARNSDVHEDYGILTARLREAAADSQCRGLVLWSEISHNDTFLLEYLADNSWQPQRLDLGSAASRYCRTRYTAGLAEPMQSIWTDFLATSQSMHWSMTGTRSACWSEPQFRVLGGGAMTTLTPARLASLQAEYRRVAPTLKPAPAVLGRLAAMAGANFENPLWRRDALDMARTIANRALFAALARGASEMEAWRLNKAKPDRVRRLAQTSQDLLATLGSLLALSDDFSMQASHDRLSKAQPLGGVEPVVNPHAQQTLKGNAENDYCRSHHYELVEQVYRREMAVYWSWVLGRLDSDDRKPWRRPDEFTRQAASIADQFYETPLARMSPTGARDGAALAKGLLSMQAVLKDLIEAIRE